MFVLIKPDEQNHAWTWISRFNQALSKGLQYIINVLDHNVCPNKPDEQNHAWTWISRFHQALSKGLQYIINVLDYFIVKSTLHVEQKEAHKARTKMS